jgi:hypothetical protein
MPTPDDLRKISYWKENAKALRLIYKNSGIPYLIFIYNQSMNYLKPSLHSEWVQHGRESAEEDSKSWSYMHLRARCALRKLLRYQHHQLAAMTRSIPGSVHGNAPQEVN